MIVWVSEYETIVVKRPERLIVDTTPPDWHESVDLVYEGHKKNRAFKKMMRDYIRRDKDCRAA